MNPLLQSQDVISCRREWISGSFCVLRNCKQVNALYRRSRDWQAVFLSPQNQMFDELGGFLFSVVLSGEDVLSLSAGIESFTHVVKRSAKKDALRCAFIDLACEHIDWGETIIYDSGKLTKTTDGSAVMYVHYVLMKRRFFEAPPTSMAPGRFCVRKTGIS